MSDEALNAHLDWLDKRIDGDDYEIWLENRVEELEAAVALAKQRTGRFTSDLLKSGDLVEIAGEFVPRSQLEDDVLRNTISLLKNENERLTKHVEDYKEENAALKKIVGLLRTRLGYYGRVLTKEADRDDVIPTAEEQEDD